MTPTQLRANTGIVLTSPLPHLRVTAWLDKVSTDDGRRFTDISGAFIHSIFPPIAKNIWKRLPDNIILVLVKQIGDIKSTGTWGGVTFYTMRGEFYMRLKSTLTAKEVRTHKAFERSRRSSSRFGRGNELASFVYRSLREEERAYTLYCELKTLGVRLLKMRKNEEDVVQALFSHCEEWKRLGGAVIAKKPKPPKRKQSMFYFAGSEDMPLRLSRRDIWTLEAGKEQDVLNVIEKLRNRLADKKKRKEKAQPTLVVTVDKPALTASRPATRRIVKPIVLIPRWVAPVNQLLSLMVRAPLCKILQRSRAPALQQFNPNM